MRHSTSPGSCSIRRRRRDRAELLAGLAAVSMTPARRRMRHLCGFRCWLVAADKGW
ncbi:MAG: hypothetical protein R3F11_22245 [Verrucomicrobiales bacterium]